MVDFIVDTSKKMRNAATVRSSQRGFEDSACAAVAKWRFKPGWKNGHAVFTRMQVPIVFVLDRELLARGLCSDLGDSPADVAEFYRRAQEAAILLRSVGIPVLIEI